MRITWRKETERSNVRKHGVDFSPAFVNGEERWRTLGTLAKGDGFKVMVVIYVYPNPDDDGWVHVISLRETTAQERKRYEISHL